MEYGTTAFDRLVLEEGQKSMVQALVAQHFRDKESKTGQTAAQVDIIKGKGNYITLKLCEFSAACSCQVDIDPRERFDLTSTWCPGCRKDINSRLVYTSSPASGCISLSMYILTVVSKQRVLPSCSVNRCSRSHVVSRTWLLRLLFSRKR